MSWEKAFIPGQQPRFSPGEARCSEVKRTLISNNDWLDGKLADEKVQKVVKTERVFSRLLVLLSCVALEIASLSQRNGKL